MRMMKKAASVKTATIATLAALFTTLAGAASVDLKPGKYALTITYEVQDQRQTETRTMVRCITQSDLQNPEMIFTDQAFTENKEQNVCLVKDLRKAGGQVSYDADCLTRGVHVEGNVRGSSFSVTRTVKLKTGEGIPLKFIIWGRRTGDCSRMR